MSAGSDRFGATATPSRSGPAPAAAAATSAGRGADGDGGSDGMASQRVALSRTRLEAMMLEAQAASTSGDAQRARSIARAVKMEAGAIRDALRGAADANAAAADAMAAAAAARAVQDAQEAARAAARRAAAETGEDRQGLAPWNGNGSMRATLLAESAPLGTPTTNLHRSAFEALRRAQEILDLLSRVDAGDRASTAQSGDGGRGSLLLNRIEAEDGALLDGWNLLA
ncbi:hypothetical protein [Caenispirillum salinarum]|uniref:hypothetical protein n=1 Tax=Caenispirillum salinarum TaxID=859058 RepID=UPI0038502003